MAEVKKPNPGEKVPLKQSRYYQHCLAFWNLLNEQSVNEEIEGQVYRVFRGKLTRAFKELGLSTSYYSKLRQSLESNGCTMTLQVGAGTDSSSLVIMLDSPEDVDFLSGSFGSPLTGKKDAATLRQEIADVKKSLGGIDLQKALMNIEIRLAACESALGLTEE